MKNKKIFAIVAALVVVLVGSAVYMMNRTDTTTPGSTVSHGGVVQDYVSFVDTLRANSATVEPGGSLDQSFFSVNGQSVKVDGQDVQSFEYADAAAMQKEADTVSTDGQTIGTSKPSWMGDPHFYKKGKLIVIYVGSDAKTLELLGKVMGPQFAGN
jgi:hypothetical protein